MFSIYKDNGHLSDDGHCKTDAANQIHFSRRPAVPHPGIAEHDPGDGSKSDQGFIDAGVEGSASRVAGVIDGAVIHKAGIDPQQAQHGKANPVGRPEPHAAQGDNPTALNDKKWRPPVEEIAEPEHGQPEERRNRHVHEKRKAGPERADARLGKQRRKKRKERADQNGTRKIY